MNIGRSIFGYACKSWTHTAELQRRTWAMEVKCYCKILCISYKDRVYQQGSLCQDPAGNRTTRRLDHRKEMQTEMVWVCLPCIKSGQKHLARHSEKGNKTRQTEKEVERQNQGMDRPGVCQVPEGCGEQKKNGRNWLWSHLWCPKYPRIKGTSELMIINRLEKKASFF